MSKQKMNPSHPIFILLTACFIMLAFLDVLIIRDHKLTIENQKKTIAQLQLEYKTLNTTYNELRESGKNVIELFEPAYEIWKFMLKDNGTELTYAIQIISYSVLLVMVGLFCFLVVLVGSFWGCMRSYLDSSIKANK
jgi:uncharacterized protein YpmS